LGWEKTIIRITDIRVNIIAEKIISPGNFKKVFDGINFIKLKGNFYEGFK